MTNRRTIAYFSMEIGLCNEMPTYAGGLGILAGDTVRAAADQGVPMVAVSLLHRRGYFYQRLDSSGWQAEEPVQWAEEEYLTDTGARVTVTVEGRAVRVRAWEYRVAGHDGAEVPVYLLDTNLPENSGWDRGLTDRLYGGDTHYRLCQEVILGFGGVRILRALGHDSLRRFHMNEGHAALLSVELMRERPDAAGREQPDRADFEAVYGQCVFTTHTPVPAGHDQFPLELVDRVLGDRRACGISDAVCHQGRLNMTYLALSMSHYVNGVAKRHGEISRHMFAGYRIDAITNGVHARTWVCPAFADLFDRAIPGWQSDSFSLRYAVNLSTEAVRQAHRAAKRTLIGYANRQANAGLDLDALTLGFARRATGYKRLDLVLEDPERLRRISREQGRIQILFAGKAHPHDENGKRLIQRVIRIGRSLAPDVRIAFLPNYDMALAQMMTAGVDVWLNTPEPPMEASGTSGMKAALNGVPSLSVLDGWWMEGWIEGLTGWAIGSLEQPPDRSRDAESLYQQLEQRIVPLYYQERDRWTEIMRHTIALNGSFFNTQRMLQQYVLKAYL